MGRFILGLLKNTLALVLAWVLFFVMGIISLAVLASGFSKGTPITIEEGSYLVIDLDRNLPDQPPVMDLPLAIRRALQDADIQFTYLYEMLETIERAAEDDRIAGIFLTGNITPDGSGSSYAAMRELRQNLSAFKEAGKPIYGYLTNATQRDLYVMSVADEIYMNPFGLLDLTGLGAEIVFYEGAFEKFGIEMQVAKVGEYKSAVEPYTRDSLSEENREQIEAYVEGVWDEIVMMIAEGREVEPGFLRQVSDEKGILHIDELVGSGLIDHAAYMDEVIEAMIEKGTLDEENRTFRQVDVLDYIASGQTAIDRSKKPENTIAVVYAEGVILPGDTSDGFIGSDTLSRRLRELRKDDAVEAVVFRVNSPGGSAYAAEVIQRELRLIAEEKPLIVSQGAYAASGGYWLSAPGHHIFAEPTTLTGSIGVYIMVPNFAGAADWMGLSFDTVQTGELATLMTPTRSKTEEEMAIFQSYAERIYDAFLDRVAEGRGMEREAVEAVAQGRVWLGADAVENGLVDSIGGLQDAIAMAVREADVGADYTIREYPSKKTLNEALSEGFGEDVRLPERLKKEVAADGLEWLAEPAYRELQKLRRFRDPMGTYMLLPYELKL